MQIKFVSAVIMVDDIPASRKFYEEILGQKVIMDHGPNVAFEGGFSIWARDHAADIIFKKTASALPAGDTLALEVYFESDELDDVYENLKSAGVEFVHDLVEQPWGQRVLRVFDPDRTIVEVGEPMSAVIIRYLKSGLSEEEIAQRSSMPLEIIRQIKTSFNL